MSQIEDIVLGWRFLGSANCKNRCSVSRGSELDKQALFPSFIRKSDPWPTRSELAVSCNFVMKQEGFHWSNQLTSCQLVILCSALDIHLIAN